MSGPETNPAAPPPGDLDDAARVGDVVIRVRGLKVGFGDHLVMDGLDIDVRRGEVLGLVGASGAGKSVFTRTVLGLLPKLAGRSKSTATTSTASPPPSAAASASAGACCSNRAPCFQG